MRHICIFLTFIAILALTASVALANELVADLLPQGEGMCTSAGGEAARGTCYQLRRSEGAEKTAVSSSSKQAKSGKGSKATARSASGKTSAKGKGGKQASTSTAHKGTGKRCQPQSLIYARCRSHVSSCRLGDTSPTGWFQCERSRKNTSSVPVPGSIMVLDANKGRGMPTGHPVYVEEVCRNRDGSYTLRISHTNYDRRCSLDLDSRVHYSPQSMTASFLSGPWKGWAHGLRTMGFIAP